MENDTSKWINLPNVLTLMRMLMIPLFLLAYYQLPDKRYISVSVFVLASLTDLLDGYLARKLNQITSFGKLCDPLADKLMVLSIMFCLANDGYLAPQHMRPLNWTLLLVTLGKELLMMCGSLFMLKRGVVVQSNLWGKSSTFAFVVGIIAVFPWHGSETLYTIGHYVIFCAVALSLCALIVYTLDSVKKLKSIKQD